MTPASVLRRRILGNVQVTAEGCWIWTAATTVGYGRMKVDGRMAMAHRVSHEAFVGPIPDGLHIDHLCRTPACVNPTHLEPVPPAVNNRRSMSLSAANADKTHCIRGHELPPKREGVGRQCRQCDTRKNHHRIVIPVDAVRAWLAEQVTV